MILSDAIITGVITLLGSGGATVAYQAIFNRDGQRAETAAKQAKTASDKAEATAREHETWFDESEKAYERIRGECNRCTEKLERISEAFYGLLEDLDDQIFPMLLLPDQHVETRNAVRIVVRKARERARDAQAS